MRLISQLPKREKLVASEERLNALKQYLTEEVEDAFSSRSTLDQEHRDLLRQYEGVPKNPVRNFPIENAPNIEITLGAIACDSIYAQMIDLIYTTSPLITVNATNKDFIEHAKAMQRFTNIVATQEAKIRPASENTALDDVQLGTGAYYIPWVEHVKKTKSSKVTRRGPYVFSVPIEDVIVPGGSYDDPQTLSWIGIRTWPTKSGIAKRAERNKSKWDIAGIKPAGNKDWVRSRRETLGRTTTNSRRMSDIYEIIDIFINFDIDGDGIDEDLLVVFDRTSRSILYYGYNPFDTRPIEVCRYQLRAHLFYGLGVMEMIKPYQEEATEIHNSRTLNMLLANCRFYRALDGAVSETTKIWPGKIQFVQGSVENLQAEAMSDVYPSSPQAQAITTALAERRVGTGELSKPSSVMPSHTSGIATLSVLQQVNRRFTPAFDAFKIATGGAVIQCLYRYQERLLMGDRKTEIHITELMGSEEGRFVIDTLKDEKFDENYKVELTVSSASVNRDADRQNAIILVNLLATYYQRTLELVAIAANPQTPEPVRDVARKIANSAGEIIERTIRTFDQIRDPEAFIVDVNTELDKIEGVGQEGLAGLTDLLGKASQFGQPFPPTGTG